MEWPKELLEIFEDPLLDGVRPKPTMPMADDRLAQKKAEVEAWMARNCRMPRKDGDLKEKLMFAAMTALKNKGLWI